MTVMTRSNARLLEQLIGLAGSSEIVHAALRDLNERSDRAPTLKEIIQRILEIKEEQSVAVAE